MVDAPIQGRASQGNSPEELTSVGLRLILAAEATIQERCGKKPISLRDMKALLSLILGDKTRQQIQESTGMTKQEANRARVSLQNMGMASEVIPQGGSEVIPQGGSEVIPVSEVIPPVYGLADRVKVLNLLAKFTISPQGGIRSDTAVCAPYLPFLKEDKEGEPKPEDGAIPINLTAPAGPKSSGPEKENLTAPAAPKSSGPILPLGVCEKDNNNLFTADHVAQQFKGVKVSGELDKRQLAKYQKNPALLFEEETRLYQSMYPGYHRDFRDPLKRNAHFIQAYLKLRREKVCPMPTPTKKGDPTWHGNMVLARQRADSMGAPYEMFIEAKRQQLELLNNEDQKKFPRSFPRPNDLKTEKAGETYNNFVLEVRGDCFRRAIPFLMDPEYTPTEFDPSDPTQRRYYQWVWGHIKASREKGEHEGDLLVMAIMGMMGKDHPVLPRTILESDVLKLSDDVTSWAIKELDSRELAKQRARQEEEEIARERLTIVETSRQPDPGTTSSPPACFGQGPNLKSKRCTDCMDLGPWPWEACLKVRQEERRMEQARPSEVGPISHVQKLGADHERQPSPLGRYGPCTTMTEEELTKQLRMALGLDSNEEPSQTGSPTEEGHHD